MTWTHVQNKPFLGEYDHLGLGDGDTASSTFEAPQ